ncbi:hypothetical protein BHM04_11850 [Macrococcus sp. IME1552]|nr:O-antigen ligase family protein [Macrococcus sp. IME1552]ATD31835.1 hypothetical protein BHM04_11850 [Macrococcus sp. IME1552]
MKYLLLLAILSMNFFIILSTFFSKIAGVNIVPLYYPLMIVIEICCVSYVLLLILKSKKINYKFIVLFLIFIIISLGFLLSNSNDEKLVRNIYLFFLLWAIPGAISGIKFNDIPEKQVIKFLKFIYFLFSISLFMIVYVPYLKDELPSYINFGLLIYQNISYISAFTIGLGFLLFKHLNKIYNLITFIVLSHVIFISGGRGGAILFFSYILLTGLLLIKSKKINNINKVLIILFSTLIFLLIMIYMNPISENSRTFSYIEDGKLNLDGTSGRNDIYGNAFKLILENMYTGYGLFNYQELLNNIPHNIILELLLIGGIPLLSICIIFTIKVILNIIYIKEYSFHDLAVIYIAIYPLVLLNFSSNFFVMSEFWFVLFYFMNKRRIKID